MNKPKNPGMKLVMSEIQDNEGKEEPTTDILKSANKEISKILGYQPDLGDKICELINMGNSHKDACAIVGVPYTSFQRWVRLNEKKFGAQVLAAEAGAKARNIKTIQDAGEKSWQAAAWFLERKYADEFALKTRGDGANVNNQQLAVKLVFKEK